MIIKCTGSRRTCKDSFIDTRVSRQYKLTWKTSEVSLDSRTFLLFFVAEYSIYLVSLEIIQKSIEFRMRGKEPKVNPITIIMNKIPFSIVELIFKVVSNHSFKTFNKVLLSSLSIMTCWSTPIIEFSMNRVSSSPVLHRQDKLMYWESEERYSNKYSDIFCKSLRTTL